MGAVTLVILNAGDGGRLGTGMPKGCLEVNGKALALHIADALEIEDPVMVIGYKAGLVVHQFGGRFRYAVNEDWATTKTGGSLLAASSFWRGTPTLVVAADHLFGKEMAEQIQCMMNYEAAILVDRYAKLDGEEQVLLSNWKLTYPIPEDKSIIGEAPEIFWIRNGFLDVKQNEDVFVGFNRLNFDVVDVAGAPWIEIDTSKDLARAWEIFDET